MSVCIERMCSYIFQFLHVIRDFPYMHLSQAHTIALNYHKRTHIKELVNGLSRGMCTVSHLMIFTLNTHYSQDKLRNLNTLHLMTLTTLKFQSDTVVVTVIFE